MLRRYLKYISRVQEDAKLINDICYDLGVSEYTVGMDFEKLPQKVRDMLIEVLGVIQRKLDREAAKRKK